MKYMSRIITGLLLMSGIFTILSSCVKKEFDEPPVYVPTVGFKSNCSIDSLKNLYIFQSAYQTLPVDSLLNWHKDSTGVLKSDSLIIEGVIGGNDESGNIYKTLYIQDKTGGLVLGIDQTSLYTEYKVGQRIKIICNGLYLGQYGGVVQLGYPYNGSIGRMPAAMLQSRFFRDSLPGHPPVPALLDVTASVNELDKLLSTVVSVPNVMFTDFGQPFVVGTTTTNRNIADATFAPILLPANTGDLFIIRTSNYANFAKNLLPAGRGTLQGILSSYNGQYQMYVRDMNDLVNFDTTGIGPVLTTIYEQNFDASPTDWVVQTPASNKPWTWDSKFLCMVGNGYLGNAPCESWLISPGINLAGVTEKVLSFKTWTQFTDSGNPTPLQVKISTNYSGSGDPSAATWDDLPCTLPAANSKTWTSSGDVSLEEFTTKIHIAYIYKSSGTTASSAAKWEVDTFKVVGKK